MEPSSRPPERTRGPAAAAFALLLASLLAGCPSGSGAGAPAAPPKPEEEPALDPAVSRALARRPDLAKGRVIVLGLDGCDPDLVAEKIAAGKAPNFQRLRDEGAFGPIRSQQPMLSPLLWNTVATGQYPTEHGVLDFMVRAESDPKKRETATSRHRQVEAIWDIAGRYGTQVGVVAWLASHPAEKVNGFMVSERVELLAYLFNQRIEPSDEGKTWPPDLLEEIQPLRRRPADIPYSEMKPFLAMTEEEYAAACRTDEFTDPNRPNDVRLTYAAADNFRRIAEHLYRERKPRLTCVYFEMLDAISHFCMAYREPVNWKGLDVEKIVEMAPRLPGNPDRELVRRLASRAKGEGKDAPPLVLEKPIDAELVPQIRELARGAEPGKAAMLKHAVDAAYEWTDRLLGEVMASMDADTTLIVLSDHGFAAGKDRPPFDSSFNSKLGGASYHRIDGILGVFGKGVRKGLAIPRVDRARKGRGARLIDVAPTVLTLLGFPKAKDMPGRVLTEVFDLDLATGSIPTYERGRGARLARERMAQEEKQRTLAGGADPVEEKEIEDAMKELAAVGYVGAAVDSEIRQMLHMGASYAEQERWAEAEEAFREALKSAQGPQRWHVMVLVGQMRNRQEDLAGARRQFEEAIADSKAAGQEWAEAHMGLAETLDRMGEVRLEIAAWERVVELAPDNGYAKFRLADALRQGSATSPTRIDDLRRALRLIEDAVRPQEGGPPDFSKLGPGGINGLGMVLLDLGDPEGAIRRFEEAVRASEANGQTYLRPRNNMAVVHMRSAQLLFGRAGEEADPALREPLLKQAADRRAEALGWIQSVLAVAPGNAKAHCNRAEILIGLPPKDLAAAEKDLEEALKTDPEYRRARTGLDAVRKALGKPPR